MKQTVKLSLISVALLSQLQAQNQYNLEAINVSASQGTTLDKKDVTDSVTVITKEAIEEARVTTLNEALSKLGGLSMTQNGGAGKASSMFIRGMSSQRILVLIDGVRHNNPTLPGAIAEFSQIMLNNVEQIEIIKGSQSGVWGSDATGAVINIVTNKAKKGLHGVANVEYGSFDSKKLSMQASYANDDYDVLIGGMVYGLDGFSAAEPKKSEAQYGERYDAIGLEKDKYLNQSLNAKLGYNVSDEDRVELNVQATNSDIDFDSGTGVTQDSSIPNTILKNRFYNVNYKHKGSTHQISANYNLSTFDRDNTLVGYVYVNTGSVNELKIDDKVTYMKDSFVRVGASYQKFEQEEITANTTKNYSATSAFATNYNKFSFISDLNSVVTESVRFDSYDNLDDSLTGKLGVKQFMHKDYYVSANLGTGYNAPTLGQLYGPYGANPDLKPEKSLTSDVTLGNDKVWISGFYNEITDLIDYVSDPITYAGGYVQIDGKSKFKGVELGYEDYLFDALGVNATYTYVKTQDANGKELARRPKDQVDLKATYYATEDVDVGLNAQYIGQRYDGDLYGGAKGAYTGKYVVVNFVSNVKINKHVTAYAKIDNLADEYYQTVDGYATAGRSLYLGLNAKY